MAQAFGALSHFSNQVTTSDVERCHETSKHGQEGNVVTILTHLDKRGLTADAIQCLSQSLVVLADILVLEGVAVFISISINGVRYDVP
jgi:hypothetical protein